jgi:hypothetical protein
MSDKEDNIVSIWFRQSNTIELIENPFLPWNRFPVDEHALQQDNTIKTFFLLLLLLSFTKCKKGGEREKGGGGCVTDGLDTSG